MPDGEPVAVRRLGVGDSRATAWEEARRRLAEGDTYWLATVRPDGRPHLMPVLAVWAEGALHFCTGGATRKGKNLARNPHCVIAVGMDGLDVVLEGEAARTTDEAGLRRVADAYGSKYDWQVTVRDGAFHDAEGAPTAGPPPYDVYEVTPTSVFGFGTDGTFSPTRWQF
jgi:nitroimidazol reductase NimA-like FMN-containing flavoprotein (pyridoxamine 5'-phosphate oxidase superfamily)